MNYPKMAAAELLDTYGDRLFCYCWSMLRSREMAQIALRDTLLAARAHIARLTGPGDPGSFAPWLYSLARAECRQQVAVPAAGADEAPGQGDRDDADSRLMAWRAAMSLEAGEFEALELASRHDVDPGWSSACRPGRRWRCWAGPGRTWIGRSAPRSWSAGAPPARISPGT